MRDSSVTPTAVPTGAAPHGVACPAGLVARLVKSLGGSYAAVLGIDLPSVQSDEVFKWFLASMLLGNKVDEAIALRTYREFQKFGILLPELILGAGWQDLVSLLHRAGYAAYDIRTADRVLEAVETLKKEYDGDLNRLHFFAEDATDLQIRLRSLGKRMSPLVLEVFLRELRGLWEKANVPLSEPALLAARNLGLVRAADATAGLREFKAWWEQGGESGHSYSDFEVALVRQGSDYCSKRGCLICPANADCSSAPEGLDLAIRNPSGQFASQGKDSNTESEDPLSRSELDTTSMRLRSQKQ